jgi:cell division transport system permease protein
MVRSLLVGVQYFFRTLWISSIAITVLSLCLGLVSTVFNTRQIVTVLIRQADKKATIKVLFDTNASREDIQRATSAVKQLSGVDTVTFRTKDEEKKDLAQYQPFFEDLGFNPLADSLVVTPTNAETYKSVVAGLSNPSFTQEYNIFRVVERQDFIDRLIYFYSIINWVGWLSVIALGLVSILVVVNIIRISISYFQSEIEIQRLVGATNSYIQGPFVVQALLFAFFSSLAIGGVQFAFYTLGVQQFLPNFTGITDLTPIRNEFFLSYVLITISTLILCSLAAVYATNKYLKK